MDEGLIFRDGADNMMQVVIRPYPKATTDLWQMGLMYGPIEGNFLALMTGPKDAAIQAAIYFCAPFVSDHTAHVLADGYEIFGTFFMKEIVVTPVSEAPEEVLQAMTKTAQTRH